MSGGDNPGRRGWAGQWDRHRWPVAKRTAPPTEPRAELVSPLPERRLRSLDEFKALPWHERRPERSKPRGVFLTWREMAITLLGGIALGLVIYTAA